MLCRGIRLDDQVQQFSSGRDLFEFLRSKEQRPSRVLVIVLARGEGDGPAEPERNHSILCSGGRSRASESDAVHVEAVVHSIAQSISQDPLAESFLVSGEPRKPCIRTTDVEFLRGFAFFSLVRRQSFFRPLGSRASPSDRIQGTEEVFLRDTEETESTRTDPRRCGEEFARLTPSGDDLCRVREPELRCESKTPDFFRCLVQTPFQELGTGIRTPEASRLSQIHGVQDFCPFGESQARLIGEFQLSQECMLPCRGVDR